MLFRLCCSLLTLLAVLPAFDSPALAQARESVAQPRTAELFKGVIGNTAVDLVVLTRRNQVLGASYRPATDRDVEWDQLLTPARLLTGTRTGSRVRLREWDARDTETAVVEATSSAGTFRGSWRDRRTPAATSFVLRRDAAPFSGLSVNRSKLADSQRRLTWPVIGRLHRAVRASQWADAGFEAELLCALTFAHPTEDGCGWIDAIAALAERREPTRMPHAAWVGLELERQGLDADAFDYYQESCSLTRSACAFMLDLIDRVDPAKQRVGLSRACRYAGLGCDRYWGRNEVALVDAARRGDLSGVEGLLTMPVNVNAGGEGAMLTALQAAVLAKSLAVVKALLDAGADLEMVNALLARGADPDFTTTFSEGSPIDRARENRQKAILDALIAARGRRQ